MIVVAGALVGTHLVVRTAVPVDETRYLSVAWEMYSSGELLVPHLNGEPYSHKPPLLFWLIIGGWWAFGVSTVWARLVASLAAIALLGGVMLLARCLWPDRPWRWWIAAWLTVGSLLWVAIAPMTMMDGLLALWVVLWMVLLVSQERCRSWWKWPALAAVMGLGLLTKGPVMLLYTVPAAVGLGWWSSRQHDRSWRVALAGSVVIGVGLAALWAVPAALVGGETYAHELLWMQTSGRVVGGVTDAHPIYWYLVVGPLVLLPWAVWPSAWRAIGQWRRVLEERGSRLLVVWALPSFIGLSLAASKQPQYLLPIVPAAALFVAAGLDVLHGPPRRAAAVLPAAMLLTIATAPLIARYTSWFALPQWATTVPVPFAAVATVLAITPVLVSTVSWSRAVAGLATATVGTVAVVSAGVLTVGADAFDLRRPARAVAEHVRREPSAPIAHGASYHGQLHYFGRLERSVEVIDPSSVVVWFAEHPHGVAVLYLEEDHPALEHADLVQRFRTRTVSVWTASGVQSAERAGAWHVTR